MLPLDNYSGDPKQEYFADGMTDELTTDLATISQLRVISRGSAMQFKGEHRPPTPQIAKLLNVDAVVEGSVLRVGDKVRITAQLIDAPADRHLWAKSYERDSRDVLALQDELASAIAREINVQLTPSEQARLTSAPTVNPEAHDAYLKGRYFFNRPSDENLKKAIAQFEEAIRLDPTSRLRTRDCRTPIYGPASTKESLPPRKRCPRQKQRLRRLSNWTIVQPKLTPRSPYSNFSTNLIGRAARANFAAPSHSIQTMRTHMISSVWGLPCKDGSTKRWPKASARLR